MAKALLAPFLDHVSAAGGLQLAMQKDASDSLCIALQFVREGLYLTLLNMWDSHMPENLVREGVLDE